MVRQQQNPRNIQANGADLLNFHFASPRPESQLQQQQPYQRHRRNNDSKNQYRQQQQQRKNRGDYFFLHSSPDHAFILTRIPPRNKQYSFIGPDTPVSWASVRIVKYFSTLHDEQCPICLDSFTCARITKCGHCYCLPCLIQHVQSRTKDATSAKCPCCAIQLCLTDVRPVVMRTVIPPRPHARVTMHKLHRSRTCPTPYVPLPGCPRRASPHAAPSVRDADANYCTFNYVDPELYQHHLKENWQELQGTTTVFKLLARDMVQQELQQCSETWSQELELMERFANPSAGIYLPQPKRLLYTAAAATSLNVHSLSFYVDDAEAADSIASHESPRRDRGDSIVSNDSSMRHRQIKDGIMYLGDDEVVFYQSECGSLCFLSGFNMKCLQAELSAMLPNETQQQHHVRRGPLPDVVEGQIVEIERVIVSQEVRQRLRFLSHLPIDSEIVFLEIDLSHLLSKETKKLFQKDFHKRKQQRENKLNAEKRAELKKERAEQSRITALKERFRQIDPNDDFFQIPVEPEPVLTGDTFGPAVSSEAPLTGRVVQNAPAISFSEIARTAGHYPGVVSREADFPALGAGEPVAVTMPRTTSWGQQSPIEPIITAARSTPIERKNRNKGKKILLFSTGGQRGNA